ncbi:SCO2322 family protein [Streptantibioticus silvisoli]|uniref:SCO2322 family protein n=1 Tax=Streptantibioticus silvisoli TaxID=2705255 RepID=UPI003558A00D
MTVRRDARAAVRRRAAAAAGALLASVAAVVAVACPAQATGYRYWSFWEHGGTGWTFAQTGPASATPADGAVEGWRFAVSADSSAAVTPRGTAAFAAICAGTPAARGRKRVALVVDYGTAADADGGTAPPRERTGCASLAPDASAADALAAVAKPLRYDSSGLVCAISGYPAAGCGEQVSGHGTTAAAAAGRHGGSPSVGLYAGIGVVVVLGAAAGWQVRRRRER